MDFDLSFYTFTSQHADRSPADAEEKSIQLCLNLSRLHNPDFKHVLPCFIHPVYTIICRLPVYSLQPLLEVSPSLQW